VRVNAVWNQAHQPIVGRLCLPLTLVALSGATLAQSVTTRVAHPLPIQSDVKLPAPAPTMTKTPADFSRPASHNVGALPKMQTTTTSSGHPLRDQLFVDQPGDGSVWAHGQAYKAQFSSQGFTYIPFLGSDAPQNYPLNLRVSSVTSGSQKVAFDASVAPIQQGDSVSFARTSFSEQYDLSAANVEQSFTFQSLPTNGDLVVRMDVMSDLAGRVSSDGLEFANELGSVRYGQAVVVDAAGHRTPAVTTFDGRGLSIRVDSATVSDATFPLTIDPVVSTFTLNSTTQNDFSPDTAYDNPTGTWLTVYEEVFSTTDHDAYAQVSNGAGVVVNSGYVDFTGDYWARPKVANNNAAHKWLVVAGVGIPTGGARIVRGRTVSNAFVMGAQVTLSDATQSGEKFNPDVGGDQFATPPSWFMVVWERAFSATDHDIHGCTLSDTNVISATILIDNSSATLDSLPSISKSDQAATWSVAWQRDFSPTDRDIYGARINFDGTISSASFNIDFTGFDDTNVSVSSPLSNASTWVVACQRNVGTNTDIQAFLINGTTVSSGLDVSTADGSDATQNQVEPSVDSDGAAFAVTFSESYNGSATDYDIYIDQLTSALTVGEAHTNLAFSSNPEHRPEIGSTQGSGGLANHFMVVWDEAFSTTDTDIIGAFWDIATTVPGSMASFCPGDGSGTACPCGNNGTAGHGCANSINVAGAQLVGSGNPSVASDSVVLTGSGMQATATGLFFQGTTSLSPGNVFGDGLRCAGGTIIRLANHTAVGGILTYPSGGDQPVHIKGAVSVGDTRYYQLWYRNAGVFCTPSTFNLTNGVTITWGT
jgi:hypothetical protein